MVIDTGLPTPTEMAALAALKIEPTRVFYAELEQARQRIADLEAIEHKLNGEVERLRTQASHQTGVFGWGPQANALFEATTQTHPTFRLVPELREQIASLEEEVRVRADNQANLRARIVSLLHELEGPRRD
jgi:hypothetical protein